VQIEKKKIDSSPQQKTQEKVIENNKDKKSYPEMQKISMHDKKGIEQHSQKQKSGDSGIEN